MRRQLLVAVLLVVAFQVTSFSQRQQRIPVFVLAADSPTGFVEPAIHDSVRDIEREIPKRKNLRLVPDGKDAAFVLIVTDRDVGDGGAVPLTLPGSSSTTATAIGGTVSAWSTTTPPTTLMIPIGRYAVRGVLFLGPAHVKDTGEDAAAAAFVRFAVGIGDGSWRVAARDATIDLERWVDANADRIARLTLKSSSPVSSSTPVPIQSREAVPIQSREEWRVVSGQSGRAITHAYVTGTPQGLRLELEGDISVRYGSAADLVLENGAWIGTPASRPSQCPGQVREAQPGMLSAALTCGGFALQGVTTATFVLSRHTN